MKWYKVFTLFMAAVAMLGCSDCINEKFIEVKTTLANQLKVGDSQKRVGEIFNSAGIDYGYDKAQSRFQSTVYDSRCGPGQAVSIYVYFDSTGNMTRYEVIKTYTSL